MHWIIENVFGKETEELCKHIKDYQIVEPGSRLLSKLSFDDKNIIRGSIPFILNHRHPFLYKENLLTLKNYECINYYPKVNNLLNSDCIFLPWGMLSKNRDIIFKSFPKTEKFFIRPNSGKKIFTGTTLTKKWWDKELDIIYNLPYSEIKPDTLVLISSAKKIAREYRVLMHKNEILDYCIYDGISMHSDYQLIFNNCKTLRYFPDKFYTIDIAFLENNLCKVLELNSFCSAGLYDMNYEKVVKEIENRV